MATGGSEERELASAAETAETSSPVVANAAAESRTAEPDLDDVIARLDAAGDKLPKKAIKDARRLRPQIIPRLIELLQQAADAVRNGQTVTTDGYFFALYLLAEFRAKEALPAIIDAVTAPTDETDLFDDAITEDLNRILAVLAVDDPDVIEKLIADDNIDMYVRWEAATTYLLWVRDGLMTREAAVERLRAHLRNAMRDEDIDFIAPLICCLADLSAVEAEHELNEAFQRDLVDRILINERTLEPLLAGGEATFQASLKRCPPSGISDTIAHLSSWSCFQKAEPSEPPELFEPYPYDADEPSDYEIEPPWEPSSTIRHAGAHVGRNDPCPCGSGKKYKKCCGLK